MQQEATKQVVVHTAVNKPRTNGYEDARRLFVEALAKDAGLLNRVYQSVLSKVPEGTRIKALADYDQLELSVFEDWLDAWNGKMQIAQMGYGSMVEKLARDVIKYRLKKEYKWMSIGVASYMTGDVTGLGIAAKVSDNVTIKILKGHQNAKGEGPSIYNKETRQLPDSLGGLVGDKKVREYDAVKRGKYTFDVYKEKYNFYTADKLKPWNKETYHATKVIGKKYELNVDLIRNSLLPSGNNQEVIDKKIKIANYKNKLIGNDKCILLWLRRSGEKGGAHKELDTSEPMVNQLLKMVTSKFNDRKIIILGDNPKDESLYDGIDRSNIKSIYEYWRTAKDDNDQLIFTNREEQQYFLKLLGDQNDAISIGMRSGTLEASALLGIKTIFIDDIGNNAEGRMEYWAGDAAYDRKNHLNNFDQFKTFENAHKGPMSNYKRVATKNELGNIGKGRYDMFKGISLVIDQNIDNATNEDHKNRPSDSGINNLVDIMIAKINVINNLQRPVTKDEKESFSRHYNELGKQINVLKQHLTGALKSGRPYCDLEKLRTLKVEIDFKLKTALLQENELNQINFLVRSMIKE